MSKIAAVLTSALLLSVLVLAQSAPARVETFSPQGEVKGVRQVQVRFSEQMVAFGDPARAVDPFDISCPAPGKGRWVDATNWVFDFDQDLPAGVKCVFSVKPGLKTLAGKELTGTRSFSFTTGGPAIIDSVPYQGAQQIDEEQIFALDLDGKPREESVLANAWFKVEGVQEKVPVRIVAGDERKAILESQEYRWRRREGKPAILLQAKRRFPNSTRVDLVWGKGILSESGVPTSKDQSLPFKVRSPFTATFSCTRENPDAACMPLGGMGVDFSASIPWSQARQIVLTGPEGKKWSPQNRNDEEEAEGRGERFVSSVGFRAPFPAKAEFKIELPAGIRDESGRRLTNAAAFPLTVRTDDYPPLAKFSANFGILELKGDRLLPVTLRDLEPEVAGLRQKAASAAQAGAGTMPGNTMRVPSERTRDILFWLDRMAARSDWNDRDKSIFEGAPSASPTPFKLPKPGGGKAFEVVGIPLSDPGFYVVELQSEVLGAALLGKPRPVYVPTTALVTNLVVHFKRASESSLVWVTTLDEAKPAPNAAIDICDCAGNTLWQGKTDAKGLARIGALAEPKNCTAEGAYTYSPYKRGYLVIARVAADMAFTHSSWNDGIEPWRYNLPTSCDNCEQIQVHTVLDRSLLRAGETLHMKHFLRARVLAGFRAASDQERPAKLVVRHGGSDQEYELPLKWDAAGIAESEWKIPREAKLGQYDVIFSKPKQNPDQYPDQYYSAAFRIEEFRVPLLKASIQFPSEPLVAPSEVNVKMNVEYLAGGGASRLPVRLRYRTSPIDWLSFDEFEGFSFDVGKVKEGLVRGGEEEEQTPEAPPINRLDLTLDETGGAQATIPDLKKVPVPSSLNVELDFRDPNGESNTVSATTRLWAAGLVVGLKAEDWVLVKKELKFQAASADLKGKPLAGQKIRVDLFRRSRYSHRKRLVGGFYAYENYVETKRIKTVCEGVTDAKGLLPCVFQPLQGGEFILEARAVDDQGRESFAQTGFWAAARERWWFSQGDDDRMDVIPEKKRYEPGETARLQVRMPFEKATALVTIEREGVGDAFVKELSGNAPVVEIPIKGSYGPNVFVSVLAVRGRVAAPAPTAMVDLAKPAYKLGITEIQVGWKEYELKVKVEADRPVYRVRDKATVKISVSSPWKKLPAGGEVALAAVDEGLLELMPNDTWKLLEAMMGRRSYGVSTSTAQMHVIGKRHFGQKGIPSGGGGGRQSTRELFDTLLVWKGRVALDSSGNAVVEVPLNDSITSFRIVAVANAGLDMFGAGSTSIRSIQELTLFSGLAPVIRVGDQVKSVFTVRNATESQQQVEVTARIRELPKPLEPVKLALAAGESREISWPVTAPAGFAALHYDLEAKSGAYSDRLSVSQRIVEAVPVRTVQATILQLDNVNRQVVQKPDTALEGWGGINVALRPSLLNGLESVRRYMNYYPYGCLEQRVSKAVALQDKAMWDRIVEEFPTYLDSEGLLKYFPSCRWGSDTLTSYVLAIAQEAGWDLGPTANQMKEGLRGFINGSVKRWGSLPTADLMLRKLAAIEALARYGEADPAMLSSLTIQPNLWPTSGVLDWFSVLNRMKDAPNRAENLAEAEQILRSRLNFQGTTMTFSTDLSDRLWWLMVSNDENAVRLLGLMCEFGKWSQDMPRLVKGALSRQYFGRWDLTTANAWGVLAISRFSAAFEKTPVTGRTTSTLGSRTASVDWAAKPKGDASLLAWPSGRQELTVQHSGTGKPWLTIQSLAAIPLKAPVSTGYKITKTISPVEQKKPGEYTKGDIYRVKLDVEAQTDMTWVVVSDPIPAGATVLGSGLGRDSALATSGEKNEGWFWPIFEERSFEAYRAYYEFVPKGKTSVEYTVRLNSSGQMNLPPTRVEALYAPEMFGEIPNAAVTVK